MDARLVIQALTRRRELASRDRWSPDRLAAHQQQRLAELRTWAVRRSPFYARHHAGLSGAPLDALPPVNKPQLMASFDDVVTTRSLRLEAIDERLQALVDVDGDPGRAWHGRWRVAATAGTTGVRGVFAWDRDEWATVVASYGRATAWAGVPASLAHPMRMAVVSSRNPTHQSAVVASSVRSALVPMLRLDARAPLAETVAALNDFGPQVLVGYASVLRPLAFVQLEGTLRVAPRAVMSASEVLSDASAQTMTAAWHRPPYDVYAATETAGIASTCALGRRHTYDDLVIVEPVDESGSPVPAGTASARLLVTVLFSRTVPLIRYELSDRVTLSSASCPCGRPFALLEAVEGRAEDTLRPTGAEGHALSADLVRSVVEGFAIDQWQLVDVPNRGELRLLVVPHGGRLDAAELSHRVEAHLARSGHALRVVVEVVPVLTRTALGKAQVVRRQGPEDA